MKRTNGHLALGLITILWAAGCDGTPDPMDSGTADAGSADAGTDDASTDDASTPLDAGNDPCDACGAAEACVRGVCLDPCGADASGWDDALGAGLTPVATFCRDADRFGTLGSSGDRVFDLSSSASSTGTTLTIARWTATPGSPVGGASVVGSVEVAHASDVALYLGGYLDPSPSLERALFGYTLSDAGFSGEVFSIVSADGSTRAIAAPGNFDAAWLDAGTFLVNGLGLGALDAGQGLYAGVIDPSGVSAVHVGTGLGDFSGSVGVGADYVVAGGYYSDGPRVYVVSRTAIEDAVDGTGAVVDFTAAGARVCESCALPSAFDLVGDRIVVQRLDDAFLLDGLVAHPIEGYDASSGLTLGASVELATGAVFDAALAATGERLYLSFDGGLLLVE